MDGLVGPINSKRLMHGGREWKSHPTRYKAIAVTSRLKHASGRSHIAHFAHLSYI